MNIHITSHHFDADQKLLAYIDSKLSRLGHYFDKIIDTQVFLKLENSGQVRDKIIEVRMNVPGDTLFASESSQSFEAATDLISDNMKRQLIRYKERMRMRS